MTRKAISSKSGVAVGPYSHAIDADGFIFLSGQTPIDPASGKLVSGSITEETKQCLTNLGAVLEAANLTFENVIKCNVFLTDMNFFNEMNDEYKKFFNEPYPARSTVAVAGLPLGARVEIEMVAKR